MKFTSWSPSRLAMYNQCPWLAKLTHLDKLCPTCFAGQLQGFETPRCDKCGKEPTGREALINGIKVHKEAEDYVAGRVEELPASIKSCAKLLKKLRTGFKKNTVKVEHDFVFDAKWNPVSKFTKGAWARLKADVLSFSGDAVEIIDWKTGGIDKRTREVREDDKYGEQLSAYATAALSALPTVQSVTAKLVFVDGPEGRNEVQKAEGTLTRTDLPAAQAKWVEKVAGMFADEAHVPSPNFGCRWCPFAKSKGGPCQY